MNQTYLTRITSTACRNSSQVLYSRGSSYYSNCQACGLCIRNKTHIKIIVFPHLALELVSDPVSHLWMTTGIEPPKPLYLLDNELLLALFSQDPAEASVIRSTPEGKVKEEEDLRCAARKNEEDCELSSKKPQVEEVKMAFGLARVEEGGEDVVCGGNTEDCSPTEHSAFRQPTMPQSSFTFTARGLSPNNFLAWWSVRTLCVVQRP